MKNFYLIAHGPTECFLVGLTARTIPECHSTIAWQRKGGFSERYSICDYDKESDAFIDRENGEILRPTSNPFTDNAWAEFKRTIRGKGDTQ